MAPVDLRILRMGVRDWDSEGIFSHGRKRRAVYGQGTRRRRGWCLDQGRRGRSEAVALGPAVEVSWR